MVNMWLLSTAANHQKSMLACTAAALPPSRWRKHRMAAQRLMLPSIRVTRHTRSHSCTTAGLIMMTRWWKQRRTLPTFLWLSMATMKWKSSMSHTSTASPRNSR